MSTKSVGVAWATKEEVVAATKGRREGYGRARAFMQTLFGKLGWWALLPADVPEKTIRQYIVGLSVAGFRVETRRHPAGGARLVRIVRKEASQ